MTFKAIDPLGRFPRPDEGCWEWEGPRDRHGYGRHGSRGLAHRIVYVALVGPVPEGLELDHLCRNPTCVRPDHLEPVTHAENVRRGRVGEVNRARLLGRTHCKNGHEFTKDNTYVYPNGERECRECARAYKRARYHRAKTPTNREEHSQ